MLRSAAAMLLMVTFLALPLGAGDPATEAVALVNAERARVGLGALNRDYRLDNAAARHATDLAAHKLCSHTGTDGSSPWERITGAGYEWTAAGETVGCGQQTAAAVVAAWMASPGHRAILLSEYRDVGMAVAAGYWTADFGVTDRPMPLVFPRAWLPVVAR